MLRIVRSNRADALLGALITALPPLDPFAPTTIVVGSHLVARWVQRELATARGIATGIELVTFDRFVEQTWANESILALDRAQLAAAIASELVEPPTLAALPQVAAYLGDAMTSDVGAPRRVQLAEQLAELAWQYAATRPDWMVAFTAGQLPSELVGNPTARWQTALLARAIARTERASHKRVALAPMLPWARRAASLPPPQLPRRVACFGVSFFSRAQLDALSDLATTSDVTVFVLDPCEPLWDDASGRASARDGDDPLLLALWGRALRDSLGALVERSGGDVEGAFVHEPPRDARTVLLADVLAREEATSLSPVMHAGVSVLACPNARRELETIACEIRTRLDHDPTLNAWDIVVWIAGDADRYLAQAPSAFDAVGVPCHLIDAPLDDRGRIGEAALALLELPTSPLRRGDLLRVMTHPAVLAGHPHVDADDWVRWTDRLGIAHGADASSRTGTYLELHAERFHWDQGVRRLALGAFMTGERTVVLDGNELVPEDVRPEQHASAATYALLVRSLCADASWLLRHEAPLTGWAEIFVALIDTYLGRADAVRELERARATLAAIAHVDLDGRRVGFREARELAIRRLRRARADRGEPLASGVMIAPLRPMRAIACRVAYVAGLDEGAFAASDHRASLDLRELARVGDVMARDRDRHAFFEVMLAARDALVLSYVARDAKSGQPLEPSSVVLELADALAPYLGAPSSRAALDAITHSIPLQRYAEPDASDRVRLPSATRERWAVRMRDALHAQLRAQGVRIPSEEELLALLVDDSLAGLRDQLDIVAVDGTPPSAVGASAPRALSLTNIRTFLESPVQAWAQTALGLEELPDEAELDHGSEPFDVDRAMRTTLLREVLAAQLRASVAADPRGSPHDLNAYYTARVRDLEMRGQFPVGVFGDAVRDSDLRMLACWRDALGAIGGSPTRVAFGRGRGDDVELVPALVLDLGDRRTIQLVGQTELLVRNSDRDDGARARAISIIPIISRVEKRSRYHLRGALDHLVLAASGRAPEGHTHVIVDRDGKLVRVEHAPWSPEEARAQLASLVRELLDAPHGYLLPLATLARALEGKAVDRLDDERALGFGPLARADGLELPRDTLAIARRRLAPLVEHMRGDHGFVIAEAIEARAIGERT